MPSDRLEGVALVTGGGRGIGASIARELAGAGMKVAVTGRTAEQVEAVAAEIGGLALVGDVSRRPDVDEWARRTEAELGPIELLVANAGLSVSEPAAWELEPEEWWHVLEVNVLGAYLSCRAVIPGMLERGAGGSSSPAPARRTCPARGTRRTPRARRRSAASARRSRSSSPSTASRSSSSAPASSGRR